MPREVPMILGALSELYQRSSSRGVRDFTCGYEELLRSARCHDGDERERAEDDLKRAELESGGMLLLDRAPRSGLLLRVRLAREGGEVWLFDQVGKAPPSARRGELAAFFREASDQAVPEAWRDDWRAWFGLLEESAMAGRSVHPFKREDPDGNSEFLDVLLGVIHWQGESLIRFASSAICGDSKTLEYLESRLVGALQSIRSDSSISLENLGILRKPRTLTFHGPLLLRYGSGFVDFKPLPGPSRISEVNLIDASEVSTEATLCLTIENEEVFLEIAKQNPNWLLVHTSFPGSAVRRLFERLPKSLDCRHFGDSDPAGFDILRDLREKTGRNFQPVCMEFRSDPKAPALSAEDHGTLLRLVASPTLSDVRPVLQAMLDSGSKGAFEQEGIPISRMVSQIFAGYRTE